MLRKSVNIFALVCVSLFLVTIPGKSQSQYNATGTVLGHVQDPSQAAVPGAKVTLHNEQTGISQVYTTSSTGDYIFINQIPDTYDVTVEKTGFHTATTPGLILQVEQTLRQDFTLEVGQVTQEVTVQASVCPSLTSWPEDQPRYDHCPRIAAQQSFDRRDPSTVTRLPDLSSEAHRPMS